MAAGKDRSDAGSARLSRRGAARCGLATRGDGRGLDRWGASLGAGVAGGNIMLQCWYSTTCCALFY